MALNKVMLIGNTGKDPEVRYAQSGTAVANFSVATNESFKKGEEKQTRTEWHRVVTFGKLAEACGNNLKKGRKVYVEGRLQTREWDDKEGKKQRTTEIVASKVTFLDPPSGKTETVEAPELSYDDGSENA